MIIAEALSDDMAEEMDMMDGEEEEGMKALTGFVNGIIEDSAELAKTQAQMAKELKTLADREGSGKGTHLAPGDSEG